MKYIILSDIHSNLQAFEAAIKSFPKEKGIPIISAGDVVGYGANPNECIEMVQSLKAVNILGNHDAAVIDRTDISYFNAHARDAVLWTKENIGQSALDYLQGLPLVLEEKLFTVVHGTLHDPEEFNYMMDWTDAMRTLEILKTNICFVGHSHVPDVFISAGGKLFRSHEKKVKIEDGSRYIINVGSIGQPRDNDSRACYCVYDSEKKEVEFHRVEYDVRSAHDSIIEAGLPVMLAERILVGR